MRQLTAAVLRPSFRVPYRRESSRLCKEDERSPPWSHADGAFDGCLNILSDQGRVRRGASHRLNC